MNTSKLFVVVILTVLLVFMATYVLAQQRPSKGEFLDATFEAIDTDNDGKISRDEYMKISEERFDRFDINDDGYLTQEEVKETAADKSEELKKKAIQKAKIRFDSIDTDNDGKISKEEWISAHPNQPQAGEMFDQIDSDGDGYMTKAELKDIISKAKEKREKRLQKKE